MSTSICLESASRQHPCGCPYTVKWLPRVGAYEQIEPCRIHANKVGEKSNASEMKQLAETSAEQMLKLAMADILEKELSKIRETARKGLVECWMSYLDDKQADRLADELRKLQYTVEKKTQHECNYIETCKQSGCGARYMISWGAPAAASK
jgi:hypothetical protein